MDPSAVRRASTKAQGALDSERLGEGVVVGITNQRESTVCWDASTGAKDI